MNQPLKIIFLIASFAISFFSSLTSGAQVLLPKNKSGDILIKHKAYAISYSVQYKQAKWDYSIITGKRKYGEYERLNYFRKDPELSADQSANNASYVGTGFDKGHLAAAEDMSYDEIAIQESFYLSNIAPQVSSFNRGIWKKLENLTRKWGTENFDTVFVISGGILHAKLNKLNDDVTIPDNFYKIVITRNTQGEYKGIAFLMPNEPSSAPLSSFVVTIDKIEALTKIDFCPKLKDAIEKKLEGEVDLAFWGLE